jgi:hypothetical protein
MMEDVTDPLKTATSVSTMVENKRLASFGMNRNRPSMLLEGWYF